LRAWLIIDSYIKLIFYRSLFYKSVFEQYIIIDLYMHNFREKEREREREKERERERERDVIIILKISTQNIII